MALSDIISVSITGNASSLQNALSVSKESVKNFSDSSDKSTNKFSTGFAAKMGGISGVAQSAFNKVTSIISNSMSSAVSRVDTLNNFPKVMSNLGISAEASQQAINTMSDKLTGLPTTLDDAASAVQRFTSKNGDVAKSTDYFLALNNALLAGGQSTEMQSTALEQLSQAYSRGKPDMSEWRSLLTAMPAQLNQVAQAMGYGANNADALGEDLRNGKVSMDDFMQKIVELNTNGANGFQSFSDQVKNVIGGIQTAITVMQSRIIQGLSAMVEAIGSENIAAAAEFVGNTLKALGVILGSLISIITENKVALEILAVAIIGVGTAFIVGSVIDRFSTFCGLLKMTSALAPASANGFTIMTTAMSKTGGFMATLGSGLASVGNSVGGIGKVFSSLWGVMRAHPIISIISVIAAAAGALGIFGTKTEAGKQMFANFGNTIKNVISNLPSIMSNIMSSIGNIISSIAESIPTFLSELATGGFADSISQFGTVIAERLPMIMETLTGLLTELITILATFITEHSEDFTNALMNIVNSIVTFLATTFPLIIETLVTLLPQVINVFAEMLPNIINAIVTIVFAIVGTIINNLPAIIQAAVQIIIALVQGLIDNLPQIIMAAIQLIISLSQALIQSIPQIIVAAIQIIIALVGALIGAVPQLIGAGIELIGGLIGGIGNMIGNVGAAIGEIGNNILSGIGDFFGGMAEAGRNLIQGLVNGIGDAAGWVWGKIQEICGSALDGIKAFFGISSPSKVMAQMGKYLMQGFGMGIENNAKVAVSAATQAAVGISDAFASNLVTEPAELKVNAQSGLQATQNAFNGTSGVYGSTASYITEAGSTNHTNNDNRTTVELHFGDIKVEGTGKADTDAVAIVKAIQKEFRSQGVQPLISNAGALR